tara:strand:+ start:169 stop:513 length:345 start_codon:yes stop_codon:yes gene_type:complete
LGFVTLFLIAACGDSSQVSITSQSRQPDLIINSTKLYLNSCYSLSGVFNHNGTIKTKVILISPTRPLSICADKQSQLNFDGTYLTVRICRTSLAQEVAGLKNIAQKTSKTGKST